jgi:hypothetical protein
VSLFGGITMADCAAKGGYRTVMPTGASKGAPACRTSVNGQPVYTELSETFTDWAKRTGAQINESVDKALGGAVETRDEIKEATGLNDGALGVAGKVLGVNIKVILYIALGLVVYIVVTGRGEHYLKAARG